MNKTRLWTLAIGILCSLLLFFGIFAGLIPQLQQYRTTDRFADDVQSRNDQQQTQIDRLAEQQNDMGALQALHEELTLAIPSSASGEHQLRELQRIADQSGARIEEFTATAAVPYGTPSLAQDDIVSDEEAATTLPVEEPAQAALPPTDGAESGLIAIPITMRVVGTYNEVIEFFRAAQTANRLLELQTLSVTESSQGNGDFAGQLSGLLFAKPAT